MDNILRDKVRDRFEGPVESPRDCDLLSEKIYQQTSRNISSTTLRRFFGMLSSKSELSKFSLDTLAVFCGSASYKNFCNEFGILTRHQDPEFTEVLEEIKQLSIYTLNSISRKSLTPFSKTISRETINQTLDTFLASDYTVFPLIAPGGYGKSVLLAHWLKAQGKKKKDKTSYLFCQAGGLTRLLINSKQSSKKINVTLGDSGNLFQKFATHHLKEEAKLVLVIDGMDEPENDSRGILQLAGFIKSLATQFHSIGFLKIIFAVREVTWNKFLLPEIAAKNPDWLLYSKTNTQESGRANLQILSNSEVKEILSLHNQSLEKPIVYSCIDWRMRELIRIPINLFVFTSFYSGSMVMSELTPDRLFLEYVNSIVFKTRYAEEKKDIIWKLIEFTLNRQSGYSVKKSHLKVVYPIHLKKDSNYYAAYQDLLSLGILNEVNSENKYGLLVTRIEFRHTNFYYYLAAMYMLDINDQIDQSLFHKIADCHMGIEWRTNVISYIYQIAFAHEEFDALKNFCDMDTEILSALNVIHTVGITFRKCNKIRIPIINEFAKHPEGQKRFFEEFVDTNYIFNNYEYRIQEYLKHKSNPEAQLFGHCILFLADFLKMNLYGCRKQMKVIDTIEPNNQIYPWPIGRKVAASIVFRHIVEDNPITDLEHFIDHYRSIAYEYPAYLENGLIEFEMYIMVALVLTENYYLLARVIEKAHMSYHKGEEEHKGFTWLSHHQNQLSYIFLDFARFKTNGELSPKKIQVCEEFINNYISFFDDFQYLILFNFFLAEYYIQLGSMEKAMDQMEQALIIAKHSKYVFFEAFLYSKGANLNSSFVSRAEDLIGESHFNPKAICFQSISVKNH